MAQARYITVPIAGTYLKSEHVKGSFTDDAGSDRAYNFHRATFLTDSDDVIEVRYPADGSVTLPTRGDVVHMVCEVRATRGGQLRITWIENLDGQADAMAA